MTLPGSVAQDGDLVGAGLFFRSAEQPARRGSDGEDVKEIRGDSATEDRLDISFHAQSEGLIIVRRQSLEDTVCRAKILRVCRRDVSCVVAFVNAAVLPNADQRIKITEVVGMEEQGIHHTEDGRIGADAQGQSQHTHNGEAWASPKRSQAVSQIGEQGFHAVDAASFTALFLESLHSAKFE